jgi:hypothetical protein
VPLKNLLLLLCALENKYQHKGYPNLKASQITAKMNGELSVTFVMFVTK